MSQRFLPYGRQSIDERDVEAVVRVLRGDWLTTGPAVEAFENAIAARVGARHAVACSSGTAGLHLAMLALGVAEGDIAVAPTLTFLASANAARFVGAEVAFTDVDPETALMTAADARAALRANGHGGNGNPKVLVPVHFAGQCADMEALAALASEHGAAIVEDACHAVGTTCTTANGETVPVGSCRHSDLCVFSFHPVKTIAMGEGGMVTTNDETLYRRLLRFRNHGMTRDAAREANPWYYEMEEIGFNYRASDIHCALGLSQLGKLDDFIGRRRELVEHYDAGLAALAPAVRPLGRVDGCRPAWHLYVALIDFEAAGMERATVMEALRERGIGTQVHYIPVNQQPYYRRRYGDRSFPGAERYYAQALSLPLFPAMTGRDVDHVIESLARNLRLKPARAAAAGQGRS